MSYNVPFRCSAADRPCSEHSEWTEPENSEQGEGDDDGRQWYNGDGVCPTLPEFELCRHVSRQTWQSLAMRGPEGFVETHLDALLRLVKNVPRFCYLPSSDLVSGGYKCPLILRSSLRIETTRDNTCDRQWRSLDYYQCLGFPLSKAFEIRTASDPHLASSSDLQAHQAYLTTITLAWSYIISCRWVEICKGVGESVKLVHREDLDYWELITQSLWSAEMKRGKGVIFSPWQLREKRSILRSSHEWVEVLPDSTLAFDILLDFCTKNHLEREFLTGFAVVLMLTSRNIPLPRMAPPVFVSHPYKRSARNDGKFRKVLDNIDRYMSLSATQDALDSLLCSAFFDPRVPCNLVGAVSLGIKEAIFDQSSNYNMLLKAIASKQPSLFFFWNAVICGSQANPLLGMTLRDVPPVCLVAACWTDTMQSFLQVSYYTQLVAEGTVLRAKEFVTSFLCRDETPVPWTPSPPFGVTTLRNLSLEVTSHIGHDHKILSWAPGSNSSSEEHLTSRLQCPSLDIQCTLLCDILSDDSPALKVCSKEQMVSEQQSLNATSRLFNWHRHYDDGLWLDDGTGDIALIRRLQRHPWITDPFDIDNEPESPDNYTCARSHTEVVLDWLARVN